jgi:hypothetical protein
MLKQAEEQEEVVVVEEEEYNVIRNCPVLQRLTHLLQQCPEDLEITILGTATSTSSSKDVEQALLLQEEHLGIDAMALPWITREIRTRYKKLQQRSIRRRSFISTVVVVAPPSQSQIEQHYQRQQQRQQQHGDQQNDEKPENLQRQQSHSPPPPPPQQQQQDNSSLSFLFWNELWWVTACLLVVNPDHATAWADRRRALWFLVPTHCRHGNPNTDPTLPPPSSSLAASASCASRSSSNSSTPTTENDKEWWQKEYAFINLLMTQHSKA